MALNKNDFSSCSRNAFFLYIYKISIKFVTNISSLTHIIEHLCNALKIFFPLLVHTDMFAWVAAPVLPLLMVPMATSVLLGIAVLLAQHRRCPVILALTVLQLEQPSVWNAPKGPCVPPQPLKSLLSVQLVRMVKINNILQCQDHIISPLICSSILLSQYLVTAFLQGHFCPAGTALPLPCPLGTHSNQTGAHSLSSCTFCPSGVYCSSFGSSTPQGDQTQA